MKRLYFLFFVVVLLFPAAVHAAEPGTSNIWNKLEHASGQALQLVKQGKYEDAKQMLTYFEEQFSDSTQKKLGLSMRQMRTLTVSYDHAVRAVNSVSSGEESRITALTQFHLVVDAIHSKKQPLWLSTKNQLFTPFDQMKQAAKEENGRDFQLYLNKFLSMYEMIHPALDVDLKDYVMERLESEVAFLRNHRSHFFSDPQYVKHLDRMDKDFHALYNGTLEDSMDPSLPWVMISIGGIIVVALVYTGWRKYRAERSLKRKKVKKRSKY